jgi:hypothetical protein
MLLPMSFLQPVILVIPTLSVIQNVAVRSPAHQFLCSQLSPYYIRKYLRVPLYFLGIRVSSGSTVSDYGLDDRAIGVRSSAGAKDFSSNLCVQTGSGAHSASCTMGTGGPFLGGKARSGRDANHSPPSNAEVVNE